MECYKKGPAPVDKKHSWLGYDREGYAAGAGSGLAAAADPWQGSWLGRMHVSVHGS